MGDSPLQEDVCAFLSRFIDSISELEALLLLRAHPVDWDPAGVARRLYVAEVEAARVLRSLEQSGLIAEVAKTTYRYQCVSIELAKGVDRLAEAYGRHLIPVTNLIHSKPQRIRQFADAFRLRKDP